MSVTTMTEQEMMWGLLKADPRCIALSQHPRDVATLIVNMVRSLNKSDTHGIIEIAMASLMERTDLSIPDIVAVFTYWIFDSKLQLTPERLPMFDEFHKRYGPFIINTWGNTKDREILVPWYKELRAA